MISHQKPFECNNQRVTSNHSVCWFSFLPIAVLLLQGGYTCWQLKASKDAIDQAWISPPCRLLYCYEQAVVFSLVTQWVKWPSSFQNLTVGLSCCCLCLNFVWEELALFLPLAAAQGSSLVPPLCWASKRNCAVYWLNIMEPTVCVCSTNTFFCRTHRNLSYFLFRKQTVDCCC